MSSVVSLQKKDAPEAWMASRRERAGAAWLSGMLPTRKTESWRYTSLANLQKKGLLASTSDTVNQTQKYNTVIDGLDSLSLVFINGQLDASQSDVKQLDSMDGVSVCLFSQASEEQAHFIDANLGRLADFEQHPFAALNESVLHDGVLLRVAKNSDVANVIRIVHLTTGQDSAFTISPRLLVDLEQGSRATIVEQFLTDEGQQAALVNSVTECFVADNAHLNHYRLHTEHESINHIGGVHVALARGAQANSFHFAFGGELKRIDLVVHHQGEGAHAEIQGIYLPSGNQHIDYHTCIEHAVPHCTSNEVFRGIIGDRARAVFNGRIHIHKDAQKTVAQLSNKNLLTSDKAEIDTKPELEIYADDVQCAHGATVAQLDLSSMHYLRSRGISAVDAEVLLSFGFINELIDGIKDDAIAFYLRDLVRDEFTRESALVSHQL